MNRWFLVLLAFPACQPASECADRLDCGEAEQCYIDEQTDQGICIQAPSHGDPDPPLRYFEIPPIIDLLFIVDGSPAGAEAQAQLLADVGEIVRNLEDPIARYDYRIAITSADVGHPDCDTATAALGRAQTASCLDRLGDFIAPDGGDFTHLCTDHCRLDTSQLQPAFAGPEPRAWIDGLRLPADIPLGDVLSCLIPHGVSDCGYPDPQEAARLFETLQSASSEPEYGFRRLGGAIVQVTVSDRTDCQPNEAPTPDGCWPGGSLCGELEGFGCVDRQPPELLEAIGDVPPTGLCFESGAVERQPCTVELESPGGARSSVPPCPATTDGPALPDGQDRCFSYIDDPLFCSDERPSQLVFLTREPVTEAYLLECSE